MGLGSFVPATATVALPGGGSFTVRGLALEDITVLIRAHYATMKRLFDSYLVESALNDFDTANPEAFLGLANMQDILMQTLESAPAFIGDLIARAADETENPHVARLLPTGVQIDAIGKVIRLTLEAEGGMEKLVETVTTLTSALTSTLADRSRSMPGFSDSGRA